MYPIIFIIPHVSFPKLDLGQSPMRSYRRPIKNRDNSSCLLLREVFLVSYDHFYSSSHNLFFIIICYFQSVASLSLSLMISVTDRHSHETLEKSVNKTWTQTTRQIPKTTSPSAWCVYKYRATPRPQNPLAVPLRTLNLTLMTTL